MPRPDLDTQAQALLFAAVHGDAAACERYGLTDRSLRRYRAAARTEGSDLSATVRRYADVLRADEAKNEGRAVAFADQLSALALAAGALFMDKAKEVRGSNPAGLDAIREFFSTILEHRTATDYVTQLFAPQGAPDPQGANDPEESDGE